MPDEFLFEPEQVLATLARHGVEFVVIGGYATVIHGSSHFTTDVDVCADKATTNLVKLAAALREMDARIRSDAVPEGLEFACDEHFLGRMKMVNLLTKHGAFDISFEPAAFESGYDALAEHAIRVEILDEPVQVAALADIIRSKETADRPKDRAVLPQLRALQDEIEAHRRRS